MDAKSLAIRKMMISMRKDKDSDVAKIKELDKKAHEIVCHCLFMYDHLSVNDLDGYITKLRDLERNHFWASPRPGPYHDQLPGPYHDPQPGPYHELIATLKKGMDAKMPSWYHIPVTISSEEVVHGYQLMDLLELSHESIYLYPDFQVLEDLYHTVNIWSEEEFLEIYDEVACSDWSKQTECGECYGGYHSFPHDSYEYQNAHSLTRLANGKALYKLPYAHQLIFKTIELGCANRLESVTYTITLCEYVRRKLANKPGLDSELDPVPDYD